MNTICSLSPGCGWCSEREQRHKNDRAVLCSACLTWRLVMSPRSHQGALPAIEGGDLPSRPSAPQHRTWFTQAVFICESQMVKHNILTASSSQVSEGQRRKAKNIPARVWEAWPAENISDTELQWPGGESALSTTRAAPKCVQTVYSSYSFIRMTSEKHQNW